MCKSSTYSFIRILKQPLKLKSPKLVEFFFKLTNLATLPEFDKKVGTNSNHSFFLSELTCEIVSLYFEFFCQICNEIAKQHLATRSFIQILLYIKEHFLLSWYKFPSCISTWTSLDSLRQMHGFFFLLTMNRVYFSVEIKLWYFVLCL